MTNPDRIPATLDFLHRDSKMRIRIYPKAGFSPRHGKPTVLQQGNYSQLKGSRLRGIPRDEFDEE
jgi:hypothetical protein